MLNSKVIQHMYVIASKPFINNYAVYATLHQALSISHHCFGPLRIHKEKG
jgi:hypothetical protein